MTLNFKTLDFKEINPFVGLLTLNRPDVLNSINTEMISELKDFFKEINSKKYRAIVITGAGEKAFCAGADLKVRNQMTNEEITAQHHSLEELNFIAIDSKIPLIAAVNGYAFGGGAEIALLCDFIYCSENATFALPEVKVGLIPGFGGTQRMARRIGIGRAKELIFTGQRLDAKSALEYGLVNKIFPQAELVKESISTAQVISNNAPISVREAKHAIDHGYDLPLKDSINVEIDCYHKAMNTEDRVEGIRAFNEKRKPEFKGK